MNILAKLTTASAVVLFSGGLTLADCVDVDTTAATTADETTPRIAKDGRTAPLQEESQTSAEATDEEPPRIAKDGRTAPLQEESQTTAEAETDGVRKDGRIPPLQVDEDLAMSQEDVEAQQKGEQTAAAEAAEDC